MPIRRLYGRRNRYVLQSGWTDILAEKAWQQQKFNCTITFKKHDVQSSSAKYYISIYGFCKECNAIIKCKIMHRPRDDIDVKIHFVAFNVVRDSRRIDSRVSRAEPATHVCHFLHTYPIIRLGYESDNSRHGLLIARDKHVYPESSRTFSRILDGFSGSRSYSRDSCFQSRRVLFDQSA